DRLARRHPTPGDVTPAAHQPVHQVVAADDPVEHRPHLGRLPQRPASWSLCPGHVPPLPHRRADQPPRALYFGTAPPAGASRGTHRPPIRSCIRAYLTLTGSLARITLIVTATLH